MKNSPIGLMYKIYIGGDDNVKYIDQIYTYMMNIIDNTEKEYFL